MRILVVEDNPAISDAVERGLVAEGFDVDACDDGLDGLWRAREFSYDAIVLDIMLPGMNGYEICRTLRSEGSTVPIMMLTAKDGEYDIAEGLDLGADDYVTKPFSFVVFVARLRSLLRRSDQRPGTDIVEVGSLAIDTVNHTSTYLGQRLHLTTREYALLEALARYAGQPITRVELIERVWGADHDTASNVVDVYIGYLRKKLRDAAIAANDEDINPIETVRGVGYRLQPR